MASSVDFEKVSVQASLLGTFIQESTRSRKLYTASPDKRELSPAVFFSYTPMSESDFVITGFFKRIFRMPTFNDLYYTEIGNANLKPERTWQYDLGVNTDCSLAVDFSRVLNSGLTATIIRLLTKS